MDWPGETAIYGLDDCLSVCLLQGSTGTPSLYLIVDLLVLEFRGNGFFEASISRAIISQGCLNILCTWMDAIPLIYTVTILKLTMMLWILPSLSDDYVLSLVSGNLVGLVGVKMRLAVIKSKEGSVQGIMDVLFSRLTCCRMRWHAKVFTQQTYRVLDQLPH
ncbi:hypothetical protein BO71DRAFT_408161 [Aspergillus ellipticus CBS 707.79]|uniref:Uncharacterized protein n=1 Tax=Aspergillus ellipticus CBS 707.79 TaxID=1448320 RepID=A0A319E5J7_9EURO|nr:hypothetical protein BO71DRAFT_408161 [Aspergillus ellipticus CBS 707.79]